MILHGWKQIAQHLDSGVRTVQRWEKLGMPVRRPSGRKSAAVLAVSEELDAWIAQSTSATNPSPHSEMRPSRQARFRYRVLVADDSEALLISLAARLAGEGYEVRTARDGFEALAEMRDATPDLLVSDLKMANMSGFELLSIVRKRFPSVAVIAYTAEFVAVTTPAVLCDRWIEKGENSALDLLEAIRELLVQSPIRAQPAKPDVGPLWLPVSTNGYFVLTCPDCLRSFSVATRKAAVGTDAKVQCAHCGMDVRYHIDDSVLPVQETITSLIEFSRERIASTRALIRHSEKAISARKSAERK